VRAERSNSEHTLQSLGAPACASESKKINIVAASLVERKQRRHERDAAHE
jgi:hypothetical protein